MNEYDEEIEIPEILKDGDIVGDSGRMTIVHASNTGRVIPDGRFYRMIKILSQKEEAFDELQEGQEVMGVVKNVTDYGAFVDLGGVDGLLHITDMAWKRVKHPSELINVGDELKVRTLKFDREKNRVSLGIKQLGDDPWLDVARRYPAETRLKGRVTNITDYGCFVELEDGVEGLVHMSEMDWTNKNVHPNKVVQ